MPIIASGIGSGIDIGGLVSQLVAAEAEPVNARLNSQEVNLGSEISAYGTLKSALSAFQSSLTKLENESAFKVFTATSSNEDIFKATADTTAVAGTYEIEVIQLAQAEKLRSIDYSSSTDIVGTGTLDISLGAETFQLTIDNSNSTLEGIRDAINSATDNPGISASLITVDSGTQLVLSSNKLGAGNTIEIVAKDDDKKDGFDLKDIKTSELQTIQSASDAIIEIDSQTVTRDSNSISGVISGVTFNLVDKQPGTVETLTVASDTESIKKDIESFVTNYNTLVGVAKGLSSFDQSTLVAGPLNGDSVIRGVQNGLRQALSSTVSGSAFSTLTDLGITLGESGSLTINDTELNQKLAGDLPDVNQFFSSDTGIANIFTSVLSGYVESNGIIDTRTNGLQNRLDGIDDKRDALNRRMGALEARLNAQFTAMDILVSQLQSTGTFLNQQLNSLPSISSQ